MTEKHGTIHKSALLQAILPLGWVFFLQMAKAVHRQNDG